MARAANPGIIIDGLTGIADPDGKEGDFALSPRAVRDYRESGLSAIQVTIGEVGNARTGWDAVQEGVSIHNRIIDASPGTFVTGRTAADIRAAKVAGKIAIVMGTQDTSMVGLDLDRLGIMQGLGVRVVQLTYNLRNLSGDGSLEPANAGLSKLGRATIARIEKEKLLLDLSHGGQRTIAEAIAATTRPMTISHTGCRSLHDNPRNVWDAELKAVANKGGVVGIYWMPFLVANSKPFAADLVRHMRHAVDVCGEDHVGIGTDGVLPKTVIDAERRRKQAAENRDRVARGIAAPGEGPDVFTIIPDLDTHRRFGLLVAALEKDRWPAGRIEKVLGGNLLRLYGDVWGGVSG
ncbi:hypothetical protein GCM10011529_18600 [Polymorphobacter glacialis]|uniref:Peptidase M19 n=2 Tax=Sandarakinorhabdus glacialis TaxID=1614636 RepID=A0A916ZSV6_9SPHN|nr:hypothetical protein GCM10011529_18600 [Polymorphobacter glacialis]